MAKDKVVDTDKVVNKGGQPPCISLDDFEVTVSDFILYCKDNNIIPSDYELWEFMTSRGVKIAVNTLLGYWTHPKYSLSLKKLQLYRESRYLGLMEANPKATSGFIFALKQPHSGGYKDKQEAETNGSIDINISLKGAEDV